MRSPVVPKARENRAAPHWAPEGGVLLDGERMVGRRRMQPGGVGVGLGSPDFVFAIRLPTRRRETFARV